MIDRVAIARVDPVCYSTVGINAAVRKLFALLGLDAKNPLGEMLSLIHI